MKSTFEEETYEDCSNDFESPQYVQCSSSVSELISPDEVSTKKVDTYEAARCNDVTALPDGVVVETSLVNDIESVMSPPDYTEVVTSPDNVEVVTSPSDNVESVTSPSDNIEGMTSPSYNVERVTSPPCEAVMSDTAMNNDPLSEMYYTASSEVSLLSDMEIPEKVQEEDSLDERKECVIAGHVAAMRERFESMTRTNTPCPDLARSMSPSLEVFRNITPSPDHLG